MGKEECAEVIEMCVGVAKKVGGWDESRERDSGYGSAVVSPEGSPVRSNAKVVRV
jgi:hypothetical protein